MPTRPTGPPPWRIANYPALTLAQAVAALFSVEFQVVGRDDFTHQLHVVLAETAVVNLAELPWVSTVETAPTPGVPENFRARSDHRANALAADYGAGRHYDGRDVTVGHDDDGRIKPEVYAVGTNVTSTYGGNLYATVSGTSMTCPGVSGVSAQLVGACRSLNAGAEAPAALLKALLMNTAEDLGNPNPISATATAASTGCGPCACWKAVRISATVSPRAKAALSRCQQPWARNSCA